MLRRWCVILLQLAVSLQPARGQDLFNSLANTYIFQPISSITTPITINGLSTSETVATFVTSDYLNQGTVLVGNYAVEIQSPNPFYNFIVTEVGRIPKAIISYTWKVCLVADPSAYNSNSPSGLPVADQGSQASILQGQADALSGARRRLLDDLSLNIEQSTLFHNLTALAKNAHPPIDMVQIAQWLSNPASFTSSTQKSGALDTFIRSLASNNMCFVLGLGSQAVSVNAVLNQGVNYASVTDGSYFFDNWQKVIQIVDDCNSLAAAGLAQTVTTQGQIITNLTNWNSILAGNISTADTALNNFMANYTAAQAALNATYIALVKATAEGFANETRLINTTTTMLENLIAQTNSNLATQINVALSYSVGNLSLLAGLTASEFYAVSNVTAALSQTLGNLSIFMTNYTAQVENDIIALYAAIADSNTILYRELSQRTLRRAITTAYFNVISNIPSVFFPLVCDPGIAPQNGGQLLGADTRLPLDTFAILKATATTFYSTTVTVYLNTAYELANGAVGVLSPRVITSRFANTNCTLPFYDTSKSWRTAYGSAYTPPSVSFTTCNGWMEVQQTSCTAAASNQSYAWVNFQGGFALTAGLCSGPISTTNIMLDSLASVTQFFNGGYCNASSNAGGWYGIYSTALQIAYRVGQPDPNSTQWLYETYPCASTVYTQMIQSSTLLGQVLAIASQQYGNTSVTTQLSVAEQKVYGALPGCGITYQDLLFDGFTGSNTGTTTPRQCHRATVNLAHQGTLPIFSVLPNPTTPLTVTVNRLITKIDPSIQTDYDQGLSIGQVVTFSEGVIMTDNAAFNLPSGTLLVGDLGQSDLYLYDPPQRLIDVSPNIYARANTVSELLMPPGTTSTFTLNQFLAASGNIYDATQSTVGANLFSIPVVKDAQGFPVCNVGGGIGDANGLQGTTVNVARTCTNPSVFLWDNNTAITANMSALCPSFLPANSPIVTPIKVFNRRLDATASSGTASTWFDGNLGLGVSFLFENSASVTILSVTTTASSATRKFSIFTDAIAGQVGINFDNGVQVVRTSAANLFDQRKHSFLFVLYTSGSGGLTYVAIFVDSVLDQFVALSTPILTRSGSTFLIGTAGNFPYGTEALYVMKWPAASVSSALNSQTVEALRVCSYAVAESHCSPNVGHEVLAYATPANAISTQTICPTAAVSLFRSSLIDPFTKTLITTTLSVSAWSLTFWLHISPGWQAAVGLSGGSVGLITLSFGTGAARILVVVAATQSQQLQLTLQQGSITFVTAVPGLFHLDNFLAPHKVSIVYTASIGYVTISFDTITYSYYAVAAFATPLIGLIYTVDSLGSVSLVRLYNYALTASNIFNDYQCDVTTSAQYINPIGYCRFIDATLTQATTYCRSPALCNGNCETYSNVQVSGGSFSNVGINMCDDGWQVPLCVTPCRYISNITGACLDNEIYDPTNSASTFQLVPSGKWCNILKAYKADLNVAAGTLTLAPRHFEEQISMPVPDGIISVSVTIIETCPIIQAVGVGNTASLTITNPGAATIDVKLVWSTSNSTCSAPPYTAAIAKFGVAYANIPTCGNMTLTVYVLSASLNGVGNSTVNFCQSLTELNVASLVAGAVAGTSNNNIVGLSAVVADASSVQVQSINVGIGVAVVGVLQSLGVDSTAFYSLANAASQEYYASNQIATDTSAIQALTNLRAPTVTTTCDSAACQSSLAALRDAFVGAGWTIPTPAPGFAAGYNNPVVGCITTLSGGCAGSTTNGAAGVAGGALAPTSGSSSSSSSSSSVVTSTSSLYNSIFVTGSASDKFVALGQFWAVLLATVVLPFIVAPLALWVGLQYSGPYFQSARQKWADFKAQRAEEDELVDEEEPSDDAPLKARRFNDCKIARHDYSSS